MAKRVIKDYNPQQGAFLPENSDDFIDENHQVRFISYLVDRMDISEIIDTYKGLDQQLPSANNAESTDPYLCPARASFAANSESYPGKCDAHVASVITS